MIKVERIGRVEVVTIDRPERRNAIDRTTAEALTAAMRAFDEGDASVAVLTGEGSFCAGADLRQLDNRLDPDGDGPMGPSRLELSKPVIAAIEGYAVAGGLELATWCDLRVCASDAVLGVFCRRWGVPLIDGGTIRLPRIIGLGRALDLILSGRSVDAEEALRIGLVDRVVSPGQARTAAIALAEAIARFPQACVRADLQSTRHAFDAPLPAALRAEFERGVPVLAEADVLPFLRR